MLDQGIHPTIPGSPRPGYGPFYVLFSFHERTADLDLLGERRFSPSVRTLNAKKRWSTAHCMFARITEAQASTRVVRVMDTPIVVTETIA
jgi:hypothetical protein